ncbi:MAG: NAD-dependent epimerase/dehydratase family protein [Deltaproteobacteria bacterium]|nr:NAD-dependent epimerase/dehydratase family protein [Deltaproteobacteria bacterium]
MATIAITGTRGFIGGLLLARLCAQSPRPRVIAIDRTAPELPRRNGYRFEGCDLTAPTADRQLARIFARHRCDVVVHAALHSQPKRNQDYSHELQSIGTFYLLHAVQATGMRKVIIASTTEVYGAFPDNPSFLTESHPLRGHTQSSYLRDKVEIEREATAFARRTPGTVVTILRPCTILGPRIRNYKTHLLKEPIIPTVLGFDPLVQFLHEADAIEAFVLAIERDAPGAFNIVGRGVVPLSHALAMIGKTRLPLPTPWLRAATSLLWHLDIRNTPPSHIEFMKYSCIGDGARATAALGFQPQYTLAAVLESFQQGWGIRHVA